MAVRSVSVLPGSSGARNPIEGMTSSFLRRKSIGLQDVCPPPRETSLECVILSPLTLLAIIAANSALVVTDSF
jgi:hypothetical protein